jgi:hypothetical protein
VQENLRRQRGKNEISGTINTVKERRKFKTVLKNYKSGKEEDR